jgi:hypothetical protein
MKTKATLIVAVKNILNKKVTILDETHTIKEIILASAGVILFMLLLGLAEGLGHMYN